jgi:hypothetical protein
MEQTPHIPREHISPKDDQNPRYAATIIIFIILVTLAIIIFILRDGQAPERIPPYDLVILALATFRLIRLFTYDQIMRVIRDLFIEKREFVDESGQVMVVRKKVLNGGRRSLSDLVSCPWCMGIWVSFFTVFLYFFAPITRYLALVLALAALGSMIQIIMNGIGAKAEFFKRENNLHN